MEITFNTPALLFPAISLLLLAYTNRFLALANRVRHLHDEYKGAQKTPILLRQIKSLRNRINLVRYMQGLGVFSFLCCVVTMYCIYNDWTIGARYIFALSLLSLLVSLVISLVEIIQSTRAIELELSDIEELEGSNFFSDLLSGKEEKINKMKRFFFMLLQAIGVILFITGCSKVGDPPDEDIHVIDHSDNVFPVLVVNKPLNNQVLNNGDTIFVEGMVSDDKTMYRGRIKISDDGSGFVLKEEFFETHVLQTINFNIFYKANVTAVSDFTVLVEFEDHGLNKVYVSLKVKVNP